MECLVIPLGGDKRPKLIEADSLHCVAKVLRVLEAQLFGGVVADRASVENQTVLSCAQVLD